jgi:hypothetical protein
MFPKPEIATMFVGHASVYQPNQAMDIRSSYGRTITVVHLV